jgi:hypothetical protein
MTTMTMNSKGMLHLRGFAVAHRLAGVGEIDEGLVHHSLSFPPATTRRSDALPVESGGDLAQRLRPCGLSLSNGRQDGVCMRFGPNYPTGVDGGAP